jgi:hypothetical protein
MFSKKSTRVTAQVFFESLRQVIDFVHCGVECHASFTKQSLSSTLEKSLAVTAGLTSNRAKETKFPRTPELGQEITSNI